MLPLTWQSIFFITLEVLAFAKNFISSKFCKSFGAKLINDGLLNSEDCDLSVPTYATLLMIISIRTARATVAISTGFTWRVQLLFSFSGSNFSSFFSF